MQPIKTNTLEEYLMPKKPTGLYVDWRKRDLLMKNVETLLSQSFNTAAVCGPQLPDNTCEISLQAIDKTGANFDESKELLISFLEMVKESKPRTPVNKEVELIDLSEEESSVTCIVLDDTRETLDVSSLQNDYCSRGNRKRKSSESIDEIIVIDSFTEKQENSESKGYESPWSIIKQVNESSGNKRKHRKVEDNVEVITIKDEDETIVLDNSFQSESVAGSSSERLKSSVVQSDLKITLDDQRKVIYDQNNRISTETAESHNGSKQDVCFNSLPTNSIHTNKVEGQNSSEGSLYKKSTCESKKNKTSKLTYKRLPHLVEPLTHSQNSAMVSSNIYNPNIITPNQRSGLRPIIIDGNNIAISHGKGTFSLKGIQICINYFERRGHRQIKAFIPQYRKNPETHSAIDKMEKQGTVAITPSRRIDGKMVASYDDRFIVQYAAEVEGVIVSNDNYRDLLNIDPRWNETIKNRLLMFTWLGDVLMFPHDPLGRGGPNLDDFLKF